MINMEKFETDGKLYYISTFIIKKLPEHLVSNLIMIDGGRIFYEPVGEDVVRVAVFPIEFTVTPDEVKPGTRQECYLHNLTEEDKSYIALLGIFIRRTYGTIFYIDDKPYLRYAESTYELRDR